MATRTYGGRTAEQRQAERRTALLDAAMDVLTADGWEGVTMRAVCARARLNDRYFYEHFHDRDDLLVTMLDEVAAAGTQHVLTAAAGIADDPRSLARAAVEGGLGFLAEDPRRGQVLVQSQATEPLRNRRQDIVRSLAHIMVEQGSEVLGQSAPSAADAELAALTLVSGIIELLTMWLRDQLDVTREHLADFLVAMIVTNTDIAAAISQESSGDIAIRTSQA